MALFYYVGDFFGWMQYRLNNVFVVWPSTVLPSVEDVVPLQPQSLSFNSQQSSALTMQKREGSVS